jgi:flavin-dependent dehydrogenase
VKGKKIIVGAGLSGLSAAITLAGRGYEVEVLERRESVGGIARDTSMGEKTYVMADGTPMDIERLGEYLGFDISPAVRSLKETRIYCFGKRYDVRFPDRTPCVLVERGSRDTSLDVHLYNLAREAGVSFEFDHPIKTAEDFGKLPRGSILATGLFHDTYRDLDIPCSKAYGYLAYALDRDYQGPGAVIYMDRQTWDYAFLSRINGMAGALIFQRKKPLGAGALDWFQEALADNEGMEFDEWNALDIGVLPAESMHAPGLFHDGHIITGTLASAQDAVLLFGVHGALVSGKIAARAVDDPQGALEEFRRVNFLRRRSALIRLMIEKTYPWGMRMGGRAGLNLYPRYPEFICKNAFAVIPGWLYIRKKGSHRH